MTPPLLILLLVLPGWLVLRLIPVPGPKTLHVIALSLAFFVLIFAAGQQFTWTYAWFQEVYWGLLGALALAVIIRRQLRGNPSTTSLPLLGPVRLGALLIISASSLWLFWSGPYNEIPADIFAHLEKIQLALAAMQNNDAIMAFRGHGGFLNTHTWYDLIAYALKLSGARVIDTLPWLHVLTTNLFLLGFYFFALHVYRDGEKSERESVVIALIATGLMAVHFGISIFNYIRYYSLAPSTINFIVYFAAASLLIHSFRARAISAVPLAFLAVYGLCMAAVHTQEALFLLIIGILLLLFHALTSWRERPSTDAGRSSRLVMPLSPLLMAILLLVTLAGITAFWTYAHNHLSLHRLATGRLFKLSPDDAANPYYLLKPQAYFYQVMTHWGVWVYLMFLLFFRRFLRFPYLVAGMLSPLFTLFNPLFIDLFLRFYNDTTIWRMSYLVPIHLVAAWLIAEAAVLIHQHSAMKRLTGALVLIPLIVFLWPIQVGPISLVYFREPTILPVPARNSPVYLMDLIDYLNRFDTPQRIVTDPVTGYVITALTGHFSDHTKFFPDKSTIDLRSYPEQALRDRPGSLVVINRRDGDYSKNGKLAHHWWANTLQTSNKYQPNLAAILESKPGLYEKLWSADRIDVFRIRPESTPESDRVTRQ